MQSCHLILTEIEQLVYQIEQTARIIVNRFQLLFQLRLTEPVAGLIQHFLSSIPASTLEYLPGQMVVGFQTLQQRALDELIPQEAVHVPAQKLIGNFLFLQLVPHRIQQQLHHIDGCLRVLLSGL